MPPGDLPPVEGPIGLSRVDVKRACRGAPEASAAEAVSERTRWRADENNDGGREGRRRDKRISSRRDRVTGQASSATMERSSDPGVGSRSALALSVRSQVNSGSVRPK